MSKLADRAVFPCDATKQCPGITLLQHYAGEAMKGLLADPEDVRKDEWPEGATSCPDAVALLAIEHAERLIARLEEREKKQP